MEENGVASTALTVLVLGAAAAGGYWYYKQRQKNQRRYPCEQAVNKWQGLKSEAQRRAVIEGCVNTPDKLQSCFRGEGPFETPGCESVAKRLRDAGVTPP